MTFPRIELLPAANAAVADDTLALIRYGAREPGRDAREIVVPLPAADGGAPLSEHWRAAQPVRHGRDGRFGWAEDGAHLAFRLTTQAGDSRHMEQAAERAYCELVALLRARGYPHPLRIWNYFDDVTGGQGEDQRYRRFCVGRHQALAAPGFERRLPAATVIGSRAPGFVLYGLAAREPGEPVENPRQISAFRYPREYGPRSPSFSRALRVGGRLYVSGTAAVVGHATRHAYDTRGQCAEMLTNLGALLDQAGGAWRAELLRLYVRRASDAALAVESVRAAWPAAALQTLQGDICRQDLMVEIEGVFTR